MDRHRFERLETLVESATLYAAAKDPTTPPEELRRIALAPSTPKVLGQVARNPNSPPDVLHRLAADFPRQVSKNPALPLIVLQNPNFIRDFTTPALNALMRTPGFQRKYVGRKFRTKLYLNPSYRFELWPQTVEIYPTGLVRTLHLAREKWFGTEERAARFWGAGTWENFRNKYDTSWKIS